MATQEHWTEWFTLETKVVYGILIDEEGDDPMTYYEDLIDFARSEIERRKEGTHDPTEMETLAEYLREMVRELVLVRHTMDWVSNKMTNTLLEMAMHKVEWSVLADKIDEDARERIKLEEASP